MISGRGYEPKKEGSAGIANAYKGPAGAAPGGFGRTIYPTGSQLTHGPVNPGAAHNPRHDYPGTTPGRNTLLEYGKDVPGKGKK